MPDIISVRPAAAAKEGIQKLGRGATTAWDPKKKKVKKKTKDVKVETK